MDKVAPTFETRCPVYGATFDDRHELLAMLGARLQDHAAGRPSWIVLLGPRKVGKTSLLRQLALSTEALVGPVVFVDLFRTDARVQDVFSCYLTELLAAACSSVGEAQLAGKIRATPTEVEGALAHAVSTALPFEAARTSATGP